MRETLRALDDVMEAIGASAQDDIAKHIGSSRIAIPGEEVLEEGMGGGGL
jgi:hypothetical protein